MSPIRTILLATAGALTLPAGASAASASLDRPCYVSGQAGAVALSGFSPNAAVTISNADLGALRITTDATGSFTVPVTPPAGNDLKRPGSREISFSAVEDANPAISAVAKGRIAPLAFATDKGTKSPAAKRRWYFSGWAVGKPIYAHFRFGGRTKGNYRFGVATGPCGEYKRRAPGIAVRGGVRAGTWTIQVDQVPTYKATIKLSLKTKTVVYTTFRPRAVTSAAALTTAALGGFYRFGGFY